MSLWDWLELRGRGAGAPEGVREWIWYGWGARNCLGMKEAAKENRQIATKLNRLREELLVLCEKRRNIAHELRIFRSIVVISKAVEFVAESVTKTNDQASQVCDVKTQIEATVLEKEMYIQKIVGNMSIEPRDMQLFVAIWRPMIAELRSIVGSSDWTKVLRYFCRKAATEDRGFAMRINLLREEIADVCEYMRNLADELCSVRSVIAPVKAADMLNDSLTKDEAKMAQLRELERQLELRTLEKECSFRSLFEMCLSKNENSEMINAYDKKVEFIRELEVVLGIAAAIKTGKFLNENLWKDDKRIQKLRNMNIDDGMKADEMENFFSSLSDKSDNNGMVADVRATTEFNDTIMVMDQFLKELDSLGVRHVTSKMAKFL
nr:hypothetical protein [Tanacetum cinerariifolium]